MGTPFQLPLAGTATLPENRTLTFERVEQDSRCPTDVACGWQGQAEIVVAVSQAGQPATEISLIQRAGDEAIAMQSVEGLTVKLLELAPYPTADQPSNSSYTVTLVITQP
ncbi:MAG: hypothetical protein Fur0046_17950 [Cyanobacteria bacterium J069]